MQRRARAVVIPLMAMAVALSATAPASADHQGRIIVVNGRPRSNVEVCIRHDGEDGLEGRVIIPGESPHHLDAVRRERLCL